ncbi:MAG: hypothetical protein JWR19_4354 [Pedosphaera sp.]|nr:hypothetical protein [Pedosphaera sp.]
MKELTRWWSEINGANGTWLLLGKGPSFERRDEFDLGQFRKVSLNHVVREMLVEVASIIDLDVVADCAESIYGNAHYLLMPRHPHVKHQPSEQPLESFFTQLPVLERMSREGRLVWYNLSSGNTEPDSPIVPTGFFNGEVVVNLLAQLGARSIRTLGMDGGVAYASHFQDLDERTRLANGHSKFDLQFDGIQRTIRRYWIDYAPLINETPVRIFIGTDESQKLGARVLEYSIRKHCPQPLSFDHMECVKVPPINDPHNRPRTGFSFNRFAIPALAGYRGRAVYLDADMLVLRDFRELWNLPFGEATVLHAATSDPRRPRQFSVLLLNCGKLQWDLPGIVRGLNDSRYDYEQLMKELCIEPAAHVQDAIPPEWNSLEEYVPERTGLIHYTDMMTQPWVSRANRNGQLWLEHLREAVDTGYITLNEVETAVRRGFARPSLLWELGHVARRTALLNGTVGWYLDRNFKPHQKLVAAPNPKIPRPEIVHPALS